jgi:hypothetical protein
MKVLCYDNDKETVDELYPKAQAFIEAIGQLINTSES